MTSNVYQVHFPNDQLPETGEEKAQFAREYAERISGAKSDRFIQYIQPHNHEASSCRITIIVPEELTEVNESIRRAGLEPAFQEPQHPEVDGNSCIIPNSFQIRQFGLNLDPATGSNHPTRQGLIASALTQHVPGIPAAAMDILNWTDIEKDEATGILILHWLDPEQEDAPSSC